MPPPIKAQVATVRHKTSVPAKFQIASKQATTATRMQALVVQKEIFVTRRGLRKPLFIFFSRRFENVSPGVNLNLPERLPDRPARRQAQSPRRCVEASVARLRRPTYAVATGLVADRPWLKTTGSRESFDR